MLPVRVLDFDESLVRQRELIKRFTPVVTDLHAFAPHCRHWMDKGTACKLKAVLGPGIKNQITFLGSGDFHHITSLLLEQFSEPVTLVAFDHHPDWDIMPPRYCCGSWVTQALKLPNLKKAVLLGIASKDISTFGIQTGNLAALRNNRVEIYPYKHAPTKVILRKVPDNVAIDLKRGIFVTKITWRELAGCSLVDFFSQLMPRIPTKNIYITVDKDCLSAESALTNWEEGCFKLDELLLLLKMFKDKFSLIGADITGEYSPLGTIHGKLKSILTRLDHPHDFSASTHTQEEIDSINERTNLKILEVLA